MTKADSDLYATILDAIDRGDFEPGARLVETDLAKRFGVSRTPVRDVLSKLETHGIATRDGRRGLTVAKLDAGELGELYDLREVMEGFAARLAARRASPAEITHLRHMVEEDKRRLTAGDPLAESNRRFHRQLHRASHNRYLDRSLMVMRRSLVLLSGTTLSNPERAALSVDEHDAIIRAIEARDEDAADNAARTHIVNAYTTRLRIETERD